MWLRVIMTTALTFALCGPPASTIGRAEAREEFLKKVDAALAARDGQAILALSDREAWRQAGYRDPDAAALTLPDGPLVRDRLLSDSEVIYKDGRGRQWKLLLRDRGAGGWAIVLHSRACPRGGMQRSPEYERGGAEPNAQAWTPLECFPLPL